MRREVVAVAVNVAVNDNDNDNDNDNEHVDVVVDLVVDGDGDDPLLIRAPATGLRGTGYYHQGGRARGRAAPTEPKGGPCRTRDRDIRAPNASAGVVDRGPRDGFAHPCSFVAYDSKLVREAA